MSYSILRYFSVMVVLIDKVNLKIDKFCVIFLILVS